MLSVRALQKGKLNWPEDEIELVCLGEREHCTVEYNLVCPGEREH